MNRRYLSRRQLLAAGLSLTGAFLTGCSRVSPATIRPVTEPPIQIVATTGMLGDAVATLGGDRVDLTTLMGPGIDPHLYTPAERAIRKIERADLVVHHGLHLEAGLSRVLEAMAERGRAVTATDRIPADRLLYPDGPNSAADPHIWFDVSRWRLVIERLRDALAEIDPGGASEYNGRAAAYLSELDQLDAEVRTTVSTIPESRRVLVTAHDAFNYFGEAYGFLVVGIQGFNTVAEAGANDLRETADLIAERQIPAIFAETSVSRRTVDALREAVRDRGWEVVIGGSLYSDALGDADGPAATYIGMIQSNLQTITAALTAGAEEVP